MTSRRLLRALVLTGAVASTLAFPASPAHAHALLTASEPADAASIDAAPGELTLTFSEAPEASLSTVTLLDAGGAEVDAGEPEIGADPASLVLDLPDLGQGVYTVTWRVVSSVDGHPTAGAFSFGVGVPATPPVGGAAVPSTPETSPLEVVARVVLFLGLSILVGAAWTGAIAFADPPPRTRALAGIAAALAVGGLALLSVAQARAAGASLGELLATPVGRALLFRAAALLIAVAALVAAVGTRRRMALLVTGVAAAGAMLAHVIAGHAAAGSPVWINVVAQWIHMVAAGVWLGGLGALLLGIRGQPDEPKTLAIRRFSEAAAVALAFVVVTGVVRSIEELGSWSALFSTTYGVLVLVKSGLFLTLAALGGLNRYRHVPAAGTRLSGLRKVGAVELGVAVAAFVAAATLAALVPPQQQPAIAAPEPGITVSASDFATSVRARLEVSPGAAGPNTFRVTIRDYDTEEPVDADQVSLRFAPLAADASESTLDLEPVEDGTYEAAGSNLSLSGPWRVTALVQRGTDAVEVPLELATVCQATRIEAAQPNQPTVSTLEVPGAGSVEGYILPLGRDRYEVHFTFLGAEGEEVAVEGTPEFSAWRPGADPLSLQPLPLSPGHYLAEATLEAGEWRFDGTATPKGGTSLSGCFEETV